MSRSLANFIAGESVPAADGRTLSLVDPSTGEVSGTSAASGAEDVDRAMRAAAAAFEGWRDKTPADRSLALLRIADAMEARADELVDIECGDTGKPVQLTKDARRGSTWTDSRRMYVASRSVSAPRSPRGTTR